MKNMTKTQDIKSIPVKPFHNGQFFSTPAVFFYKENGTKYYIDRIDKDYATFTIRNSKTGRTNIVLTESELLNGSNRKSFCFSY